MPALQPIFDPRLFTDFLSSSISHSQQQNVKKTPPQTSSK